MDSIIIHKTDFLVVLDDIVGEKIEEDTELLVNWLTEEEKSMREIVLGVAIARMGGIGKTTLAIAGLCVLVLCFCNLLLHI